MQRLTIITNPFDATAYEDILVDNIVDALMQRYSVWPENARLYCGQVALQNDVTPKDESECEDLLSMEGDFTVIEYPGAVWIYYAIIIILAVYAVSAAKKAIPTQATRNNSSTSPNNALSGRSNQARINSRIPDIFGTVKSTPDLLSVPYSIFKDNIEFEYSYMCVGRGKHAINADTIKDGQTVVSKITGTSVEIYGPFTSPNKKGNGPQLLIGSVIDRPVISTVKSKAVNGQVLLAPNEGTAIIPYADEATFVFPNSLIAGPGKTLNFNNDWSVGDNVYLTTSSVNPSGFSSEVSSSPLGQNVTLTFHSNGTVDFPAGAVANSVISGESLSGGDAEIYTPYSHPTLYAGAKIEIVSAHNSDGTLDFSGRYVISNVSGDTVTLGNASLSSSAWAKIPGGTIANISVTFAPLTQLRFGLSGLYIIASVSSYEIKFTTPDNIRTNNSWNWLQGTNYDIDGNGIWDFQGDGKLGPQITLSKSNASWIGPFVLDVTTMTQVICNFVALQGMYKDDGVAQSSTSVDIQLGCTLCDTAGNALGSETYYQTTIVGSATDKSTVAGTLIANLPSTGRYSVRARRLTKKDTTFAGTVVDEVKWRDVYGASPVGNIDFGNVTTVYAVTQATRDALAVSDRQLNMIATRCVPVQGMGSDLFPTNYFPEILRFICNDPKIGNRNGFDYNEINFYDSGSAVKSYFGFNEAADFCYTFDTDLSFEETITMLAGAVFCTAHRRGRQIELSFERETNDSVLLFNHRNKVPKSETRTTLFGGDSDGKNCVEYDYVSPIDDAIVTYYIPEDRTGTNPKQIESVGVRNVQQAHLHAYREYNKLLYQNTSTQFQAMQEVEIVSVMSRVLITDNTRPDVQDGEIETQNGLVLTLSQPVVLTSGVNYVIYLQHVSGYVENIGITGTNDPYVVILDAAPAEALSLLDSASVKAVYQIVKSDTLDTKYEQAFLLTDKSPQDNFVTQVTAINYDKRYYRNDLDFAS